MNKLLPCPFCGSKQLQHEQSVSCRACGAKVDSEEKWNMRVSPTLNAYGRWRPIGQITDKEKHEPGLWLHDPELIDEDFCPSGCVEGCWCEDEGWYGAVWNGSQDVWNTSVISPTHFMFLPPPPDKQSSKRKGRGRRDR